jgi:hypothetical protein
MMPGRTYTDEDRVRALAALEINAGNVTRASREVGIPRTTIIAWRDQSIEAIANGTVGMPRTPKRPQRDWADLYGRAASLGAQIITRNLKRYRHIDLKPSELRDVAVVSGIAVDKHLDYRDGRKSNQVTVDNRQQNLTLPEGTTLEDLRALRDGMRG